MPVFPSDPMGKFNEYLLLSEISAKLSDLNSVIFLDWNMIDSWSRDQQRHTGMCFGEIRTCMLKPGHGFNCKYQEMLGRMHFKCLFELKTRKKGAN